jgi:sigma-B regulation protein RsbU (phosphoserine phosphatase)
MQQSELKPMPSRHPVRDGVLRERLLSRRDKLRAAIPVAARAPDLVQLLGEVDAALARMDGGTYGICDACQGEIENDRLMADPLCRTCIDDLSAADRRTLERDLDLAFQVQRGLLPDPATRLGGWSMAYAYEPAGLVSGDYCDLIASGGDGASAVVLLGDITGKGVAASMLMAHLHATFRSLVTVTHSVTDLVSKANRVFCQGALPSHFATLVCVAVGSDGAVEVCNAGHCLPLHVGPGIVSRIDSTGLPLGVFAEGDYVSRTLRLSPGDSLVLYTDGVSEAFNPARDQYGTERLNKLLDGKRGLAPKELVGAVQEDVQRFRSGAGKSDDLTVMVLRREG